MRTVKPGVLPQDRPYSGTCKSCGCVVEAKKAELKTHAETTPAKRARPGAKAPAAPATTYSYAYVDCPTPGCGEHIRMLPGPAEAAPRPPWQWPSPVVPQWGPPAAEWHRPDVPTRPPE